MSDGIIIRVEQNLRICKMCNKLKTRRQDGKFNEKDKKWRDDDNLLWMGSTCGLCNRERVRNAMKLKREKK
jgi:hypothetical protein